MDGAGRLPLPDQQLRNQKCAQKKEDRHAKGARRAEVEEPWIARCVERHEVHAVKAEHAQESEESQRIQLRTVVTAQTDPQSIHFKFTYASKTCPIARERHVSSDQPTQTIYSTPTLT